MRARVHVLALLVAGACGCKPAAAPESDPKPCEIAGTARDPQALAALYSERHSPLVLLGSSAWRCACGPQRRLGTDEESRKLASDDEARHRGDAAEDRGHGAQGEGRARAADDEARRRGSAGENRAAGAHDEGRRRGDAAEDRSAANAAERRRFGDDASLVTCATTPACDGFVVHAPGAFAVFDGRRTSTPPGGCVGW